MVSPLKGIRMSNEELTKVDGIVRVANNICSCGCERLIPKRQGMSWKVYHERKYYEKKCYGRGRKGVKGGSSTISGTRELVLDDGSVLPIGGYINEKTDDLRKLVDFYLGLVEYVGKLKDDCGEAGTYKGIEVDKVLISTAWSFLIENSLGKPGQRKEVVKEAEMSREDLILALKSLEE